MNTHQCLEVSELNGTLVSEASYKLFVYIYYNIIIVLRGMTNNLRGCVITLVLCDMENITMVVNCHRALCSGTDLVE